MIDSDAISRNVNIASSPMKTFMIAIPQWCVHLALVIQLLIGREEYQLSPSY